jgi:hypothetical protein
MRAWAVGVGPDDLEELRFRGHGCDCVVIGRSAIASAVAPAVMIES